MVCRGTNNTGMTGSYRSIPPEDYVHNPWKNGLGVTRDVLILPEGTDHSSFDLRIAFSPITESARFSTYEDVERVLTVVKGDDLSLAFDHRTEHLSRLDSLRFDCELPVIGTPGATNVEVINVMARSPRYRIETCSITNNIESKIPKGALSVIIPLSQDWVVWCGKEKLRPKQEETLLIDGPAEIFAGSGQGGKCLFSVIRQC